MGQAFASRVAASLLKPLGLDELIATDLEEYFERARALAQHPERLAALRRRLAERRDAGPPFDTDDYRRQLESAFRRMWERAERGELPADLHAELG
jgi:predicted O-linked N-acetylglucosamine transferase (SPINDLY family)